MVPRNQLLHAARRPHYHMAVIGLEHVVCDREAADEWVAHHPAVLANQADDLVDLECNFARGGQNEDLVCQYKNSVEYINK
jgi:hypothetical protein